MRSRLKYILLLFLIIFSTIVGKKVMKKNHLLTYEVDSFNINESYRYNEGKHWYDIIIKNKEQNYTFTINENLGKKEKIIKQIISLKSNNLTCIIPQYQKTIEPNIYCTLDKEQVSNYYLQSSNNKDFKKVLEKAKQYNLKLPTTSNSKKKYKGLTIYKKNIEDNTKYIIWDYKGIFIFDDKNEKYQRILSTDLYDNIMSAIVDNLYVLFDNRSVNGIEKIYYYDLKKEKLKVMYLEEKISKDSYINGVVNNLLYLTDRREKKQYCINIKDNKVEVIGQDNQYEYYHNNKINYLSKSDFFISDKYFDNEQIEDKDLNFTDIKKEGNYLYYLDKDKFYKVLETNKKKPILLFELADIKEWKIVNDTLLIVSKDSLYVYSDNKGLSKIITYNELNYNYKNIYNIWKK